MEYLLSNKKYFFGIMILLFSYCQNQYRGITDKRLIGFLSSNNIDSIMEGNYIASKNKRKDMVCLILKEPYDSRISHNIKYKGMSVYQSKISALRNISGLNTSQKITYKVDSTIVAFYYKWAIENDLVEN